MNQLRKLLSQTAVYGLSSIVGRVLNYLMVPIYTSVFAAGEYGVVTDFYAYVAFFNVIYLLGLETTYFRFVNKKENQSDQVFNEVQTLIIIVSFTITFLLIFFASDIVAVMQYPGQEKYVYFLASVMAIDAIVAIPFAKLRYEGKALRFATLKLINIVLVIFLNLLLIVWIPDFIKNGYSSPLLQFYDEDFGVGYVFLANLLANALYLILLMDQLLAIRIRISWSSVRTLFSYSMPLVFLGLAGVTNEMLSRAILKYRLPEGFYDGLTNLEVLGVFGACYKLSVFMALSIQAFKYAAEPFFFKAASDRESPQLFSKVMNGYIIFACALLMLVVVNLWWLGGLFLRREIYLEGLSIVPWLLLGGLFLGIYYNLSIWFKFTDKTIYGAYISGIGAILTVVLNWYLIPVYGYMASAIITAGAYFSISAISYFYGQRFFRVPYTVSKIVAYIAVSFGVSFLLFHFPVFSGFSALVLNNLIALLVIWSLLKVEGIHIFSIFRKKGVG